MITMLKLFKTKSFIVGGLAMIGIIGFSAGSALTINADSLNWHANTPETIKQASVTHFDTANRVYTIQWGDTVNNIAQAFNVDANKLVSDNDIQNADLIYTDTPLKITSDTSGYKPANSQIGNAVATQKSQATGHEITGHEISSTQFK